MPNKDAIFKIFIIFITTTIAKVVSVCATLSVFFNIIIRIILIIILTIITTMILIIILIIILTIAKVGKWVRDSVCLSTFPMSQRPAS